jgi:hypothetical protein
MTEWVEPHVWKVVERWEDVPDFASENEEAVFWGDHCLSDALLAQMERVPPEGDDMFPPATERPQRPAS